MKICKIKNFDSENNSTSIFQPFHRGKIKIKNEVVPIGINVLPSEKIKNSVDPIKWNLLLKEKGKKLDLYLSSFQRRLLVRLKRKPI